MANLVTASGNSLVTPGDNQLITAPTIVVGTTFPLMLLMRLRIHAILFWGTILLMQTIP